MDDRRLDSLNRNQARRSFIAALAHTGRFCTLAREAQETSRRIARRARRPAWRDAVAFLGVYSAVSGLVARTILVKDRGTITRRLKCGIQFAHAYVSCAWR